MHPPPGLETRIWDPGGAGPVRSRWDGATFPAEAPAGGNPSCLFQLLGAPGIPGLGAASLPALPPSLYGFSSVSMSPFFFSSKDTCHWIQSHQHPRWAHPEILILITSVKNFLFYIGSHAQVLRDKIRTYSFETHNPTRWRYFCNLLLTEAAMYRLDPRGGELNSMWW